jgi:hypothetical protein
MMMQGKWSRCLSGVGGVALIGGLVLASYGGGVAPAEAHDQQKQSHNHPNPFRQIMDKLTEVLDMLNKGGGGGGAGNYTMRWDTNKPSVERFTIAFPGAVLDNNTGLVWEKLPSGSTNWADARLQCLQKAVPAVGGTRGWRLPSVVELASMIDASPGAPLVPVVFEGVPLVSYWSATTNATSTTSILTVDFGDRGLVGSASKTSTSTILPYWCVRGPMSESVY